MESILLNSIIPKEEPNTLPISVSSAIYYTKEKRLKVINDIITKRNFAECCKRTNYEYRIQTW